MRCGAVFAASSREFPAGGPCLRGLRQTRHTLRCQTRPLQPTSPCIPPPDVGSSLMWIPVSLTNSGRCPRRSSGHPQNPQQRGVRHRPPSQPSRFGDPAKASHAPPRSSLGRGWVFWCKGHGVDLLGREWLWPKVGERGCLWDSFGEESRANPHGPRINGAVLRRRSWRRRNVSVSWGVSAV